MKPNTVDTPAERRNEKKKFAKEFGRYIRKIREEKKISQEDLALKAGYYRTYIGKIEQGLYSPSLHTIWRIAYALDMSLGEFLKKF